MAISRAITAEVAAAERVRREKARRDLVAFAEYVAPWYQAAWHHKLVARALKQVELYIATEGREGIGRLMVLEPPRHGKTEQVSRMFPAWLLGRQPNKRVILTSYGADLAQDDSRAVRSYVTSERYAALFGDKSSAYTPVDLSEDSRAKANWELASPHRGGVVAAGVGGGITGKGAHLLVIDDPFKNRDEAESEAYRRRVKSWYQSSAYTRLEKGGAVVITHTRWHPDDLAGDLLQEMASDPMSDQWLVIYLPALALADEDYAQSEDEYMQNLLMGKYIPLARDGDVLGRKAGEPLWPEKFSVEALGRIEANVGEEFTSLYQQLPEAMSGGFFAEDDFDIVDYFPEDLLWVRYCDLALGRTKRADWNASAADAFDAEGNLYIRDMITVRELDEFLSQVKSAMKDEREFGTIWGFEDVAMQSVVMREFLQDQSLANVAMTPVIPRGSKLDRARPVQTRARQGRVKLVRGAWNKSFIRQMMRFPTGKRDDEVDTVSGGVQMLAEYKPRKKRKARSYQG